MVGLWVFWVIGLGKALAKESRGQDRPGAPRRDEEMRRGDRRLLSH